MLKDDKHGVIMRNTLWSNFVYLMARKHKEWARLCMTNDLRFSGQAATLKGCTISEKPYPGANSLAQVPLEDIQDIAQVILAIVSELSVTDRMLYFMNICGKQTLSALSAKTELTLFSPRASPSWTIEDEFGDIRENGAHEQGQHKEQENQVGKFCCGHPLTQIVCDSLTIGVSLENIKIVFREDLKSRVMVRDKKNKTHDWLLSICFG